MHTVELLPDADLECAVRDLWDRLRDAGLPSLAGHPHPTNRPHLTVITAASIAGLANPPLPVAAHLGPARFLGRALVLDVVPTDELRDIHARAWSSLSGNHPWPAPLAWVPHISLALKVPQAQRAAALRTVTTTPARGRFVAARSYDSQTRTVADL